MMLKQKAGLPALADERRSNTVTSPSLLGLLSRDRSQEIVVQHHVKTLGAWFYTWWSWQRRVLICHVMGHCSKQQLELLATSLEPMLHMDFSTALLPPLQALHLEGVAKFHIQRNITQRLAGPQILTQVNSRDYLSSLPTTFQTGPRHGSQRHRSRSMVGSMLRVQLHPTTFSPPRRKRSLYHPPAQRNLEPIHPSLPLVHPNHLMKGAKVLQAPSIAGYKLFSSLPDFHSASGQLKNVRDIGMRGKKKWTTFRAYTFSPQMYKHRAEDFKGQLRQVAIVMM